jgi:general secretion pathway protein D
VNTLGTKAQVEVVSAPKIMTLNNRPARLEVGDQVPLITQSSQSVTAPGSPIIDSVDYRSTGIILSVTPQITNGDEILLSVNQEVSSVSETTSSSINSPTIQQRKFDSTVVLKDGGTVALGGLISAKKSRGASGLPLVSSVPVIGALFGSQKFDNDRTELIVLLSATIVNDQSRADAAMANLLDDMHEVGARGLLKSLH